MKLTLESLRRIVRTVLEESTCSKCGYENPYGDPADDMNTNFVCRQCKVRAKAWGPEQNTDALPAPTKKDEDVRNKKEILSLRGRLAVFGVSSTGGDLDHETGAYVFKAFYTPSAFTEFAEEFGRAFDRAKTVDSGPGYRTFEDQSGNVADVSNKGDFAEITVDFEKSEPARFSVS